jgi:protein-tyrosine phosphatase
VLRHKLAAAGLEHAVRVDSAGTHGYHTGEAPDPRAVRHGAARGYALGDIRARPFGPADFSRHQWLLAMDAANLAWLQRKAPPGYTGRIELLLSYGRRYPGETDVPDPYYGAPAGFERVLDLVEDACEGVLERLKAQALARS